MVAEAQTQLSDSVSECTERRGQTLELLARDLIYRSGVYADAGQFDWAARSLDQALQMVARVEDPHAKTELISNIASETGGQPGTMERIIAHAVTAQQQEIPLGLLPKVVEAAQTLDGDYGVINSKRATLIRLAHYYTMLDQPDQARSLLEQAQQLLNSLHGDGFGLIASPVAEGYAALGDRGAAIQVLDQALQHTEAMTTSNRDYLADIFSAIATAYAHAGAEQQALQVAGQIEVVGVQAKTLAAIASHVAQTLPTPQVNSILSQALALTQTMPVDSRSDVLSQIALVYAERGERDTALEVVDAIASPNIKIQTLAKLASISYRAHRPEAGTALLGDLVAIAQTIEPFYGGDSLLREIFNQYVANQQYGLAFQLSQMLDETSQSNLLLKLVEEASVAREFAIALQAAEVIPPGWENQTRSLALRSIAAGYAQAGQFEQAIQLLQRIEDTSAYPSQVLARVAIAQSYRQERQPNLAIDQLNQALQSLENLDDSPVKLEALSLMAIEFTQLEQPDRALEMQTQALNVVSTLDPSGTSSYGIEQLITQYLRVGEYDLALQLVEMIETEPIQDRFLQIILRQRLEVGDLEAVWQAADNLHDPNQKVAFWVKISDHYRGRGQTERATEILARAFAIAQAIPGPDSRNIAEAAQIDPSVAIWNEFDRGSLIESIAIRYAELQQDETARQTVQALRSPANQEHLLRRLICYREST